MKIVIRQIKMLLKYRIVLKLIYYLFPIVFIMKNNICILYQSKYPWGFTNTHRTKGNQAMLRAGEKQCSLGKSPISYSTPNSQCWKYTKVWHYMTWTGCIHVCQNMYAYTFMHVKTIENMRQWIWRSIWESLELGKRIAKCYS